MPLAELYAFLFLQMQVVQSADVVDFFISELLFADDCELVAHSVNNSQFTIDDFPYVTHPSTFSVNLKDKGSTTPTKTVARPPVLTAFHLANFLNLVECFYR